ncbi:MAG: DUF2750 domain-containing protein [Alphaproteobacteria bacterium]|nr:DUF2750 domain-containing protein [Alphaproteobacteria bacterium]
MPLKIKSQETQNVTKLSGKKRYQYFIKKVTDSGHIWGLYNDGWALAGDEGGEKFIPLWPSKEYASLCAIQQWKGYNPECVDLHEFLNEHLNELIENSIKIAVFYTPQDKGVIPTYEQFKKDLCEELSRIE